MLPKLATVLLTASLAASLAGCGKDETGGGGPTTATSEPGVDLSAVAFEDMTGQETVTIEAADNSFAPRYVEVSPGTTVTFTNTGRNKHDVVPVHAPAFDPIEVDDLPPRGDAAVSVVPATAFDEPGDIPYYCSLHGSPTKGMTGAIRVVDG